MPHEPITLRQDVLLKGTGGHDRIVLTQHQAPADGDDSIGEDTWKEYDLWAAGEALAVLEAAYPGHCWRVVHDSFQGMAFISIPVLMGVNRFMAVNLKTHALDDHRVKAAGGEILERYGLKRGRFQEAPFLDARAKHSALVMPSRQVPE